MPDSQIDFGVRNQYDFVSFVPYFYTLFYFYLKLYDIYKVSVSLYYFEKSFVGFDKLLL